MAYANRGGIPPNRAHTALPLWPDILTISRGNPDAKKNDILLNLGLRMGQNRPKSAVQPSCTGCARWAPKTKLMVPNGQIFRGFTSRLYRVYQIRLICALDDKKSRLWCEMANNAQNFRFCEKWSPSSCQLDISLPWWYQIILKKAPGELQWPIWRLCPKKLR